MDGDHRDLRRVRAWGELVRLPEAVSAGAATLAGALIAGAGWRHLHLVLLLVLGAGLLSMGAAALNDFLDFKHDRTVHPGRPLPSGRLRRLHALAAAMFLASAGLMAAGSAQPGSLRIALILCAGLIVYEFVLKTIPAGPVARATCRAIYLGLGLTLAPNQTGSYQHAGSVLENHQQVGSVLGNHQFWLWGYLLVVVMVYWFGVSIGGQPGRQLSARGRLALAGGLCALAAIGMVMLPAWFDLAGSRLAGATLAGGAVALVGYRLMQAILEPSGGQSQRALEGARLASIVIAAAAVAYTRSLWASFPVLLLIAPAIAASLWIESPGASPHTSEPVLPVREKLDQGPVKAH